MAGPVFRATGTAAQSASAATLSPAKPTVDGQNGLLICVVFSKNNAVHSTATAGWSKLGQQNSGASFTASVFYAAEGAAAPTITWTGAAACAAQIEYYSDPANVVDTTLGANSVSSGATATHTSTAVNTTRNNSLVILLDVSAANTNLGTPAGWTKDVSAALTTAVGHSDEASKSVATSGSSSGATSVTGANAAWVAWQIEVMGQAPTAGLQSSKLEVGAMEGPPAGLSASKLEVGAMEGPPAGLSASKLEVGALIRPTVSPAFSRQRQYAYLRN